MKADPVGTAPASGHDASAPARLAFLCSLRLPPLLTLGLPVLLVRSQWTCLAAALPLKRGLSKAQNAKGAGANLRRRLCFCHSAGAACWPYSSKSSVCSSLVGRTGSRLPVKEGWVTPVKLRTNPGPLGRPSVWPYEEMFLLQACMAAAAICT